METITSNDARSVISAKHFYLRPSKVSGEHTHSGLCCQMRFTGVVNESSVDNPLYGSDVACPTIRSKEIIRIRNSGMAPIELSHSPV